MAGVDLPLRAIREQVASAVDLIVHQSRLKDGTRKITNITEVQGMEGDVIVMQDVFVFEQTGVDRGQDPGTPQADRYPAEVRREVRDHGHQPAARSLRLHVLRRGGGSIVDMFTLAVAGIAALAVILIALGIASSGSSGISDRLERYASGRGDGAKAQRARARSPIIAQSQTLANLNKVVEGRDFGANLARELARADLRLKPSEYLFIWLGSIVGVPVLMFIFSFFFPALGSPLALLIGAFIGFLLPRFWLNRRKNGRLNAFNKQRLTRSR